MTSARARRLAKLTPPNTVGLVDRPRLFRSLDTLQAGGFAWVSGPGGAGKTSLVATWLAARGVASVWYSVDAGDSDPATLFHYLGLAVEDRGRRRRHRLPHLTPEYLAGLDNFSARFFRQFFARLAAPCALVFDNCHEARRESAFEQVVSWALREAPPGLPIVCVSRAQPGPAFARWTAAPTYVGISWDDLRLHEQEAIDIARERGYDEKVAPELRETVQGWAAGLVLTLRARRYSGPHTKDHGQAQEALFDYFANVILAAADEQRRDFLLQTALLPQISPGVAAELTGCANAASLLEELHQHHFFTERRSAPDAAVAYTFHPLFREFLRVQAKRAYGSERYAAMCRRAADLLESAQQPESAVGLRIEAADWAGLGRAICTQAPGLMEQGRWQTLNTWLSAVPEELVRGAPWLLYWRAVCSCMHDPFAARPYFSDAFRIFSAAGDQMGALLACAGIVEASYLALAEQKSVLPWIEEFTTRLAQAPALTPEIELRVIHGLLGVWVAQPQHPMLAPWAKRATDLLRRVPDPRVKAGLIAFVTSYYVWAGQYRLIRAILDEIEFDAASMEAAPLSAISACVFKAGVAWQDARHEEAYELVAVARKIADESGVHVIDTFIAAQEVYTATSAWDAKRAREALARIRRERDERRTLDVHQYSSLYSGVLMIEGRNAEAIDIALTMRPTSYELGAPFIAATIDLQLAQFLLVDGQYENALEPIAATLDFAYSMPSLILQFHGLMAKAYAHFMLGDEPQGRKALQEALTTAQAQDFMNIHPWWIPSIVSHLMSRALEANIQPEYVRRFIRHRGLEPDSADVPGWPWPVRVYTLGEFRVLQDETPLKTGRKAPRRVLELLQAIVAMGPRKASRERLVEAVWPDAEGDNARDAFEITLHRLRKLLGEAAVTYEHGHVTLVGKRVWIDAEAFEHLADEGSGSASHGGGPARDRAVDKALTLYAGHFLANEPDHGWALPMQQRLRSKLERLVTSVSERYEREGRTTDALELYQRAIELDPLAETFYHRLMLCHVKTGHTAQALEVYRRCRHMLSVVLGIAPSAQMERLHASLRS